MIVKQKESIYYTEFVFFLMKYLLAFSNRIFFASDDGTSRLLAIGAKAGDETTMAARAENKAATQVKAWSAR